MIALSAAVAAVVGIVAALAFRGGGAPPSVAIQPASRRLPPLPPKDAFVLAEQDRDVAVALAARPSGGGTELTATVVGSSGFGLGGLRVRFGVGGNPSVSATACGAGCYRARTAASGAKQVVVHLAGPGRRESAVRFELPAAWPPASAAVVARAGLVFRRLRTVVAHERLSSGPGRLLVTTFELAAPNKLAYRSSNGAAAVVIGARRWDRGADGRWEESDQQPLPQPRPPWQQVSNAHVLATGTHAGRPAWRVTFLDPRIPAWFDAWVDRRTHRTLELRMIAAAHFMHERYSGFNQPLRIRPPRS